MSKRIIFHIDVNNAFLSWTAVHKLQNGESLDIRKIPAVIGGDEKTRHGIVLAKSPVAKKFGIKTAETLYVARKKCPNLKVFPAEFEWYFEQSNKMYDYLCNYTPIIERFSIDECFLDLSGTSLLYKDYNQLAYKIKEDIKNKFGFTVNVGIGNSKLCAKMASDFDKPDKIHTLYDEEIKTKMWVLPIEDLFMVGKKTAYILRSLNINTIGDLAVASDMLLKKYFKNQVHFLKDSANGVDNSKVGVRKAKNESISISETLPYDCSDFDKLKEILFRQTEEVTRSLRRKKQYARTITITYKNNIFETYSHQEKIDLPQNLTTEIYKKVLEIFKTSWREDPIRNIGIRLSDLVFERTVQVSIFTELDNDNSCDEQVQHIIDNINEKYGSTSIIPASIKISGKSNRHEKTK